MMTYLIPITTVVFGISVLAGEERSIILAAALWIGAIYIA